MSRATILPAASAGASRERVVTDHARVASDWYVEPGWCTELLLQAVDFVGPIWDPCCGCGTIPKTIQRCGNITNGYGGSDLVYRGYGEGGRDFLADPGPWFNLIFNPPYNIAEQFILHALDVASCKVAALVNLKFLASQGRRERLFKPHPPAAVLILSRRPSMPPGGSGIEAKGGTADYCWVVWENEIVRKADPGKHPIVGWLA